MQKPVNVDHIMTIPFIGSGTLAMLILMHATKDAA
jgi:hypothetical protein